MLGTAPRPVVVGPGLALAGRGLLGRPEAVRPALHVGVLVTDPGDRPGRARRLVAGLRLGLASARDLDCSVTAAGTAPFGPAVIEGAVALLDQGVDVLVVTSVGLAGLVGPLCAARGVTLVVADEGDRIEHPWLVDGAQRRRGVLRRTERHWEEAYVLGRWAKRQLDGSLFQLVTREEDRSDAVLALRAGFVECGGEVAGSVEVWPRSATAAAQVARVSGARVVAVHATGHQLREIVAALRAAHVPAEIVVAGRGIGEPELADLGRAGAVYAASAWRRDDLPELADSLERETGERADATLALGHDLAGTLADACRDGALGDLTTTDGAAAAGPGLVVRRAVNGRVAVVARRESPRVVPDIESLVSTPAIAALPHHG